MRVIDIIREFVEPEQGSTLAADLSYLIDNGRMSDEELAKLVKSLKIIAKTPDASDTHHDAGLAQAQPVQQQAPGAPGAPAAPEQEPATEPTEEPIEDPMDYDSEEEEELQEAKKAGTLKDVLAQYLSTISDPNDPRLKALVFSTKVEEFRKIAKEIVKKKIKFKHGESYIAIQSAINNLAYSADVITTMDFLNDCSAGGVVDAPSMISGEAESAEIPLTNPEYKEIVREFLNIGLSGNAAVGKGEVGMAFCGIDSIKETSDISIAGSAIELKASQGTSDFYMKGKPGHGGFGHQISAVKILVKALNKVGGKFQPSNEVGKGGVAALNEKTVKALQPYFNKMGAQKTRELLVDVISEIHKNAPGLVDEYAPEIVLCVDDDGNIDYNGLLAPTAKLNFAYYMQMEKHEGVLMINIDSFTYSYITDPEAFAELVSAGTLKQKAAVEFRSNSLGGLAYFLNP